MMSLLAPILTANPITGAERLITTDLLADAYLLELQASVTVDELLEHLEGPWKESLALAPGGTSQAITTALRQLALATRTLDPSEVNLDCLDHGARIHRHLSSLLELWNEVGEALPTDLQVMRSVIRAEPRDALEPLPIVDVGGDIHLQPAQLALQQALLRHHGAAKDCAQALWRRRQKEIFRGGRSGTALHHVQTHLTAKAAIPCKMDASLSAWFARDPSEEADLAAAICQRKIENGLPPQAMALLVPDDATYLIHVERAFEDAGLPLSGLPKLARRRDLAAETLRHFVMSIRPQAPAMARASLVLSPLMAWSGPVGAKMARQIIKGRGLSERDVQSGRGKALLNAVTTAAPRTESDLATALGILASSLTSSSEYQEETAALKARARGLAARLAGDHPLEWDNILDQVQADTPSAETSARFVEGVSVIAEGDLPWRGCQHLIVLGANAGRYPRPAAVSPFALDSEIDLVRRATGLQLPTRRGVINERLELFRRQLLCARESCTILYSARSLAGGRVPRSAALALIARQVDGFGAGADIHEAETATLPCAARRKHPSSGRQGPTPPANGRLELNKDLFSVRTSRDGVAAPQSPSRLETLMVSPLAWTLGEFGAEDVVWGPETYDPATAGTLAHYVLEHLFPEGEVLPEDNGLEERVRALVDEAAASTAPYFTTAAWRVEHGRLVQQLVTATRSWRGALEAANAKVIANEVRLQGSALGLSIRGQVDSLLALPTGEIMVVDHKKSSTGRRRDRMEAGWDLQVAIYRQLLKAPVGLETELANRLASSPSIGVAYHLINDLGILTHGLDIDIDPFEVVDTDISSAALSRLKDQIALARRGTVTLNAQSDWAFFNTNAKLTPYALDASPIVAAFAVPDIEQNEMS